MLLVSFIHLASSIHVYRYRPTLPVDFLVPELGFSDRDECLAFLEEMNVTLTSEKSIIDCKTSMAITSSL